MSFRFGGDDFLEIALDEPLDQVQEKCDQLLLNLKKARLLYIAGDQARES